MISEIEAIEKDTFLWCTWELYKTVNFNYNLPKKKKKWNKNKLI